jgi:hypothetical protein
MKHSAHPSTYTPNNDYVEISISAPKYGRRVYGVVQLPLADITEAAIVDAFKSAIEAVTAQAERTGQTQDEALPPGERSEPQ